uniref:Uncharacterized protein n=1 Tax=viral metagenome TaxID=1070528 RepID=A0A6C0EQ47_9ZZZZ
MRFIDSLCPPALLYMLYVVIHTGLDLALGRLATAAIKIIMGVAGVIILDSLCSVDLGIVSWVIVATPFIMVALASSISLGLGMDRMAASMIKDGFSNPLTGDNLKNRDKIVTHLKQQDAAPVSTSSLY